MSKSNFLAYIRVLRRSFLWQWCESVLRACHSVINTRDTITFQSNNAKQLDEEFQVSVDTYLDFCKDLGGDSGKAVFREVCVALVSGRSPSCCTCWSNSQPEPQRMGSKAFGQKCRTRTPKIFLKKLASLPERAPDFSCIINIRPLF